WGFLVSTILALHATAAINSLGHVWGTRRYETRDQSRNNAVLAVLTLGEGWHNNHHHCMSSARQGSRCWEVDVTYATLRVLAAMRVTSGVRTPSARALAAGTGTPVMQPVVEPPAS